ncbi:MAG: GntR family transcriptional regulator [Steroidobacteraceae bacterium]|nr:GntR family transcriptional regulator [Steroidobacteraceae bacterium]
MSAQFEPIRIEPAYRKVAAALLARITDRSLAAGDRLPSETELARQFGVNRSTVREAMRELESSGLIGRQRGSKLMVVTRPEHHVVGGGVSRALALHNVTFFNVWEALTILEPPLAETAAKRRTEADLQLLQQAVAQFKADNQDSQRAVEHVASFFRRLGEATHNPALALAQEPLIQLLAPSLRAMIDRVTQARTRIATAQARMLEAVKARDGETAASWMAKHIRDFKKGYEVAKISLQAPVSDEL